jgi:hypothetical protein
VKKRSSKQQLDLFADTPHVVAPKAPQADEAVRLKMLADARREVRNLTVIGMRPDISADEREIIRQLERSAGASQARAAGAEPWETEGPPVRRAAPADQIILCAVKFCSVKLVSDTDQMRLTSDLRTSTAFPTKVSTSTRRARSCNFL